MARTDNLKLLDRSHACHQIRFDSHFPNISTGLTIPRTLGRLDDLLERGGLKVRVLDHLVGDGHVLGVVLVVVELERARRDVGLQGRVGVCGFEIMCRSMHSSIDRSSIQARTWTYRGAAAARWTWWPGWWAVLCCAVVVSGDGEGPRTKRVEGLSVEIEGVEAQTGLEGTV